MSLLVQKRVKTVAEGVAAAFDMEVEVELKQGGYLPVGEPSSLGAWTNGLFEEKDGIELIDIESAMTGEDFGYLLSRLMAWCFGWVSIVPTPFITLRWLPKEEALAIGVDAVSSFLKKKAAE